MKKLITGAVAALALLFGFASCSGDLHDNDVQPLYIVGLQPDDGRKALTVVDSTTQELKFTYKYNDGNLDLTTGYKFSQWTNEEGVISFKICKDADTRTWRDWGGINDNMDGAYTSDVAPSLKINSSDFTALNYRGTALAPSNPGNVYIYDLVEGSEYTITVKYISASDSVSVKVSTSGSVVEMPEITLAITGDSKNFPAKDKNKKDIVYAMNRAGTGYSYNFIAKESETVKFHFESTLANTIWGAPKSDGELSMGIASDSIADIEKTVEKNHKYKISVDASNGLKKPKFKVEEIDCIEAGKAGVSGDYIYSGVYYTQATASNGVSFKPTNDTFKFKILRDTTSEYPYWGKGSESFEIGKSYSPEYCADDSVTAKPDYIEVKGLIPGKPYRLQINNDKDPAKITVTVKKVSEDYKWFWIQAPADSKATVIFNDVGTENYQTDNMNDFLNTKKKTVVYEWLADGSKDNAKESNRTDYPKNVLEEKDGFVNIYVYANCTKVSVYAWGANAGAGGELFGGWSGTRMTSDDYDPNIKATVRTIEFKNFEGKKLYALDGKLPGNEWSIDTPNVIDLINNAGTMTLSGDLEITSEYSIQIVVDPADAGSFWNAKVWGEGEVKCAAPTKTGNYKLVADGTAKTFTLVEL